jgi:hypothetical protein
MNANNILIKGRIEMKKMTVILISVMTIAVLITFNTAIASNGSTEIDKSGQTPSLSITPEEMEKLSTLVANIANEVKIGNMTPEVQARTAEILIHVSHMLSVMASPDDNMTYSIIKRENKEVKEVEKEWNPWGEIVEH